MPVARTPEDAADMIGQRDVRAFGAVGNGTEPDTAAIQAAIDTCHADGSGEVFFPPGTYLSCTIRLRGGVTLRLGPGAILSASRDVAAYGDDVAPLA